MIQLWWSSKLSLYLMKPFSKFVQEQINRLIQGGARYGTADANQLYFTRLTMEVKAYKRSRNKEHLRNIANYAFLESAYPEQTIKDDPTIGSATRGKIR